MLIYIIILVFTFMQGIYSYISETNHVSRAFSFSAVLYLQFLVHIMLYSQWNKFCTFTLALSIVCLQCLMWLFCLIPKFCAFLECCSGVVWVIFTWFQSLLLLLLSLLFSHSTCAVFLLWGLYILKFYHLLSWLHFCHQELQCLLTGIVLFICHRL